MSSRVIFAGLVFAALAFASCKGCLGCKDDKPTYARETPSDTINSFRDALEKGRIPEDIPDFFIDPNEVMAWKLRCKDGGCKRAKFHIDEVVSEDEYAARYLVTFDVFGDGNLRVMSGRKMPITFAYQNGVWYFDQIGTVSQIKLGKPAPAIDAGSAPAIDGGEKAGGSPPASDAKPAKK